MYIPSFLTLFPLFSPACLEHTYSIFLYICVHWGRLSTMGTRMQSLFLYLWRVYTNILLHVVRFCRSVGCREFVKVTVNNHEYSCNLIVTRHSTTHVCTVRVKMRLWKLLSVIKECTFQVKKCIQLPTHLRTFGKGTSLKGTVSRDEYFLDQRLFRSVFPMCAVAFNYTEVLHSVCGSVRSRENVFFQDHRWFSENPYYWRNHHI